MHSYAPKAKPAPVPAAKPPAAPAAQSAGPVGTPAAFDFSAVPPHGRPVQAKLAVGESQDSLEREADRAAERVMQMPAPQDRRAIASGSSVRAPPHVQMSALPARSAAAKIAPNIATEVLDSPGQPLDTATRAFMEPRFGRNFSAIRVHTDSRAARSADALQAQAFAAGQHIVFGASRYRPESTAGRLLLAHELAHTIQQGAATPRIQRKPPDPGDKKKGKTENTKLKIKLLEKEKHGCALSGDLVLEIELDTMPEPEAGETAESQIELLKGHGPGFEKAGTLDPRKADGGLAAELSGTLASLDVAEVKSADGLSIAFGLDLLAATYAKGEFDLDLVAVKLTLAGEIDKNNIDSRLGKAIVRDPTLRLLIHRGLKVKVSLEGELGVTREFYEERLKTRLAKLLAAKAARLANRKLIQGAINKSAKSIEEALAQRKKIRSAIGKTQSELRGLKDNRSLSPEEMAKKLETLKDDLARHERDLEKLEKSLKAENEALRKARDALKLEKDAVKQAYKQSRRLERQLARFEKLSEKLAKKIARQRAALERLGARIIRRAAAWLEEKAGKYLAAKAVQYLAGLVAEIVLFAIPIIGELLLIWDAVMLLWDVVKVLWAVISSLLSGEDIKDGGDGGSEDAGKSGETGSETGPAGEGGSGDGAGDHAPQSGGTGKPSGGEKGGTPTDASAPKATLGDSTQTAKDPPSKTDAPKSVPADTLKAPPVTPVTPPDTVKKDTLPEEKPTVKNETGHVQPYTDPQDPVQTAFLGYKGTQIDASAQLTPGATYRFTLKFAFRDQGVLTNASSDVPRAFTFVAIKDGQAKFKVAEPFVVQTSEHKTYFPAGHVVQIPLGHK